MKHKELLNQNQAWVALLWNAMGATGKGYQKTSMKRTGKGDDRRPDKLEDGMDKHARAYKNRHSFSAQGTK